MLHKDRRKVAIPPLLRLQSGKAASGSASPRHYSASHNKGRVSRGRTNSGCWTYKFVRNSHRGNVAHLRAAGCPALELSLKVSTPKPSHYHAVLLVAATGQIMLSYISDSTNSRRNRWAGRWEMAQGYRNQIIHSSVSFSEKTVSFFYRSCLGVIVRILTIQRDNIPILERPQRARKAGVN